MTRKSHVARPARSAPPVRASPAPWSRVVSLSFLSVVVIFTIFALRQFSNTALRGFAHGPLCAPTDLSTAATVEPPLWVAGGLWEESTPISFTLALPATSASFVAEFMSSSGGIWARVESMIFLNILTSPKVRHAAGLVVDVGANLGYFSALSLALGYRVIALEPQPRAQPFLVATARRNGFGSDRLSLYSCAVGGARGTVEMINSARWEVDGVSVVRPDEASKAAGASPLPSPVGALVPLVQLADVVPAGEPVALLKIDTEGFERGVFAGITPSLLASVRNIVVEVKTAETRLFLMSTLGAAGFVCRQYQEEYVKDGVGATLESRGRTRVELGSDMATRLKPCDTVNGADPEDFWFSREDFPWDCATIGC